MLKRILPLALLTAVVAAGAVTLRAWTAAGDAAAAPDPLAPRESRIAAATGMTHPPPGSGSFAGANFWNIDWQGRDEYFRQGVDFARTEDPWLPALLEDLRPYRVLRFMDWNDTNARETIQAHFATRKRKTDEQNQPVALEWQIDLCNRTDKDCWINLHHLSSPADWQQVAELVKTSLKPSLRVYIEWSNEVWNEGFPQSGYAKESARRLGLPGARGEAASQVYASVRMFEEFDRVFAGQSARVVRVLAGQAAWTGPCEAHLEALKDRRINPRGTWPDVYAIAPYLHGTTMEELRKAVREAGAWTSAHAQCARRMGVPLISYEGGTDSFALGKECSRIQHEPGMRALYLDFLDTQAAAGLRGPYMQYTHSGECWGLKERTGDSANISPKYQGLMDWLERTERNPPR